MRVIFCTNNLPFSVLIKLVTWSQWHHCGVIVKEQSIDYVIHAKASEGVIKEPLSKFKLDYPNHEIRIMNGDSTDANDLLGHKYDFGGAIGHYFSAWNDPDKWFCSELVAYCLDYVNLDFVGRFTPQRCYAMSLSYTSK